MEKIRLLLYCTKGTLLQWHFKKFLEKPYMTYGRKVKEEDYESPHTLNGKIVAECDFEVEEIRADWGSNHIGNIEIDDRYDYYVNSLKDEYELCKKSCLTMEELDDYLKGKNGFAIHIKNLNIFDEPRELNCYVNQNVFSFIETNELWQLKKGIEKAPQNMMYCYGKNTGEKYVLISIRPEYLVRILNKEKTIEVRKKVLKVMLENEKSTY